MPKKTEVKELGEFTLAERECSTHGKERLTMTLKEERETGDDCSEGDESRGTSSVGYSKRYADRFEDVFGKSNKSIN
jgi:hypothetical protein